MRQKTISLRALGVGAAVALLAMLRVGAQSGALATFTENGPAGFHAHGHDGPSPWAGAISAVVPDPGNPDIMWIGAVNGGVWKTTNATHANPHWVPLTDHQESLSIGALALDTGDANVLVAGIAGNESLFYGTHGPATGLLRTTDRGSHWEALGQAQLAGEEINGVVVNSNRIIASSGSGIWRSDDTGATFYHLGLATMTDCGKPSNIVRQKVTALVGDPVHFNRIYAAIPGSPGGVYASADHGCSWADTSMDGTFGRPSGENLVADALRISLAVHDDGTHEAVYAAILDQDRALSGVFRSDDRGVTWTTLDTPPVAGGGGNNLTIHADPASPSIVYLGGDERAFFRCDASFPRGIQCASIAGTDGTSDGSAPHEDSRSMAFDAAGNLLETDDGGIFQRPHPRRRSGLWRSLNGNLGITETHSCAWDHVGHVALCGTQDNGVIAQQTPGAAVWKGLTGADGGNVKVTEALGFSIRYYSTQFLREFTRDVCIATFCSTQSPTLLINTQNGQVHLEELTDLTLAAAKPHQIPIAAHALNPNRLVIATGLVYESDDGGDTLTVLEGFTGAATRAIAFGSTGLRNILYVGSSDGLFRHTTKFGAMHHLDSYNFGVPVVMALDPDDWQSAWVVNADRGSSGVVSGSSIWHTSTGGVSKGLQDTWTNVTGNLGPDGAGAQQLHAIAFARGSAASVIFVGARDGLYAMYTTRPGCWFKLHGALPNAVVYDLDYDATDDLLLIATLGRGTWTIASPGNILLPTAACDGIVEVRASPLSAR